MRSLTSILAAAALFLSVAGAARAEPFSAGQMRIAVPNPTAALRDHGDRMMHGLVWYPASGEEQAFDLGPPSQPFLHAGKVVVGAPFADAARHPLVVLSHGFGGSAAQLAWLGTALARRGYVVVAVDHPGGGTGDMTDAGVYAPWERADDVRLALDFALADPALAPHIDPARIGVGGFSLGGFTTLLVSGARTDISRFVRFCNGPRRDAICNQQIEYPVDFRKMDQILARPGLGVLAARKNANFRDPRVRAAFAIAPAAIQALDPASLRAIGIPVDIVLGGADPIAPPGTNGEEAARLIPHAHLVVLPRVGHYDFIAVCTAAGVARLGAICVDRPGVDRAATHATAEAEAIAFFDRTLAPAQIP